MANGLKNLASSLAIICSLLLFSGAGQSAQSTWGQPRYKANEILVMFQPGILDFDKTMIRSMVSGSLIKSFQMLKGLELHRLPDNVSVEEAIAIYQQDRRVLYAEPNYIVHTTAIPDDTRFSELWGLHNIGQSGGTPDADIDAPEAWNTTTGSGEVVVGVLDTGIDYNHSDLSANMFNNPLDCNNNGIDEDNNGYINDCHGIDVINGDTNPMDDHSHGSHVAGTIGAKGNNGNGVVGVNWNVSLMACKFLDASGSGTTEGAITCLEYFKLMKDRGVNLVATNNSWGGGDYSQALYDAIRAQMDSGILFIAAAGNGTPFFGFPINNDQTPMYPCTYDVPNIICVAATTRTDNRASFSNYGRHTVHLGAPGHEILSTTLNNSYGLKNGTSMATPHVSGVAALLKAANPSWDWKAIKNLIVAGGDNIASMVNTISQKRLNANSALQCENATLLSRLTPVQDSVPGSPDTPIKLSVLNINCALPNSSVAANVTVDPGGQIVTLVDDGTGADMAQDDGVFTTFWTPPTTGNFTLTFPDGSVVSVVSSTPVISVTPNPLDFVGVNVGEFIDKTLTVQNIGGGVLTGAATTSVPFAIVSGGNYSLAQGQSQAVMVRFTAPSEGAFSGSVNFTGGGGASVTVSGNGVIPPNLGLSFDGKLRDRVGMGDKSLSGDGTLDGTFTVTLQAGSGNRTVIALELTDGAGGIWNTTADAFAILGAAASLDDPLYNASNASVTFSVTEGGSFNIFAGDSASGNYFQGGKTFTLTANFSDGSTASASTTLPVTPPANIALSYDGKLRDRVGLGDKSRTGDGTLDGTFTVTLQAGSGDRTVIALELTDGAGGIWNTTADAFAILGAAASLDGSLYNAFNASVTFPVAEGGSFNIFAGDSASGSYFQGGKTFTLTANFSDGSTASASTTLVTLPPASIALNYEGTVRDRVGLGDKSLSGDGTLDGTFTVTLQAGSGDRTVIGLELTDGAGGIWNTTADAFAILGAAASLDDPLYNAADASVTFPISDGGSFNIFAGDSASGSYFQGGKTFTLTANFSDGSTASASTTLPVPPTASIALNYEGRLRDRVGRGDRVFRSDGILDGTFTVTLLPGSGNRTIRALDLRGSNGAIYNSERDKYWALGAADSLDAPLYYTTSTANINLVVFDGSSFMIFAGEDRGSNSFFTAGTAYTLTATFSDGSVATAFAEIPTAPSGQAQFNRAKIERFAVGK